MKSITAISFIVLTLISSSYAEKIEGFYITWTNDTVKILMDIPTINTSFFSPKRPAYEKIQNKVKHFDATGGKHTLQPEDAKEICFDYNNERIRMLSVPNQFFSLSSYDSSSIFLKLAVDGTIRLFYYYDKEYGVAGPYGGGISWVFQKNNEFFWCSKLSFKKEMKEYLADCPEVASKVDEKEYTISELELIVKAYNASCGN